MQRTEMPSMFYGAKRDIFEKAKSLRENMTPAESELWNKLNKSQLGFRFKAQHPIDIFIADFYCHQAKLVVEIDGGIHMHQTEYDLGRTAEMENYGIRVIRFSNYDVFNNINIVLEEIKKQLKYSVSHPHTP
jgi:very-short-patch-repair endonuclease